MPRQDSENEGLTEVPRQASLEEEFEEQETEFKEQDDKLATEDKQELSTEELSRECE